MVSAWSLQGTKLESLTQTSDMKVQGLQYIHVYEEDKTVFYERKICNQNSSSQLYLLRQIGWLSSINCIK